MHVHTHKVRATKSYYMPSRLSLVVYFSQFYHTNHITHCPAFLWLYILFEYIRRNLLLLSLESLTL